MRESDIQSLATKYFKKNKPPAFEAHEFKLCKERSFNFNKIEPNQLQGLWDVKHVGVYWKLSDLDFRLKVCDAVYMKGNAYLGICWYKPRKPKVIYMIDIDVVLTQIKKGCKSITEEEGSLLSEYKIIL